jgi:hypothetical protein
MMADCINVKRDLIINMKRMKGIRILLICFLFAGLQSARADEGMWLPQLLAKINESRMKSLGMKISAADIYSINKSSLKDAVVSFGGFCTSEVISSRGLLLTNHHCGFDAIQNHSTLEKKLYPRWFLGKKLRRGNSKQGAVCYFHREKSMDVSKEALKNVTPSMTESERQSHN